MAVCSVNYVAWGLFYYFSFDKTLDKRYFLGYIFPSSLPLYLFSIIFTVIFLHTDKVPCFNPRDQLSVYDPDKRFIMVDGGVLEDSEVDEETPGRLRD